MGNPTRASALDNQNAGESTNRGARPIRSFLVFSWLSFPHPCFFTFVVWEWSEAEIINMTRLQ